MPQKIRTRLANPIALAASGSAPPSEIRVFAMGKIETTKGTFLFDKVAAASVMAAWKSYGNDLCFDYEHKSVDPEGRAGDGKAAGWFQLELRADGLYAVNIKWTSQAAQQIAAKEWRYFSPTFDFDRKTGRILELLNVALTNIPATKNLPALVAAAAAKKGTLMKTKAQIEAAKKAAKAKKLAADKAAAKLGTKKTKKTVTEITEDDASADVAADEGDLDEGDDIAMDDAEADELDELDDGDLDEDADMDDDGDDDAPAPPPPAPPAKKKKVAPPPAPMKKTAASRVLLAASKVFGTSDPEELKGAFMGVASLKKSVETLLAREDARERDGVKNLVELAIKDGRITPASRKHFVALGLRNVKRLKGILSTMPKRMELDSVDVHVHEADGKNADGTVTLSRDEAKIARLSGAHDFYVAAKKAGTLLSLDRFLASPDDENTH